MGTDKLQKVSFVVSQRAIDNVNEIAKRMGMTADQVADFLLKNGSIVPLVNNVQTFGD